MGVRNCWQEWVKTMAIYLETLWPLEFGRAVVPDVPVFGSGSGWSSKDTRQVRYKHKTKLDLADMNDMGIFLASPDQERHQHVRLCSTRQSSPIESRSTIDRCRLLDCLKVKYPSSQHPRRSHVLDLELGISAVPALKVYSML